jgi:PAS domain S-box-containing protein
VSLEEPSEIITSLYVFYKDHVKQLQNAGYSPKEAFWLNFACLPFLPWDEKSENEICLSQVLTLYFGIYRSHVDSNIKPDDQPAFIEMLKDRFNMVQNIISTVNPPRLQLELGRFVLPDQSDEIKWAYAGSIVLNTKLEWEKQQRHYPIPCKLVEDYEPIAMDFFLTDTSKLKKVDRQPINPYKIAEYVLSESPVTIYICKVRDNWAAKFISKSVRNLFGYEPHEFLEDPDFWLTHIHPDDIERVLAGLSRLFESDFHSHEYRFRHKDGSYRWVRDELRLIRDEEGKPLQCVGYMTDITARKTGEQKVEESEQRYGTPVESLDQVIAAFDENGRFLFINRTASVRLGGNPEEYIGKTMWDIFPKDIADRQMASIRKVIRTGQKMIAITTTQLQGGPRRYHTTIEPVQDRSTKTTIALVMARDIHTVKQAG